MNDEFILTNENYYTKEADQEYMSVHQYFEFCGTLGYAGCEERAMAKLRGEWKDDENLAFLIGSYVDTYFEGTLETFKAEHPELFTQKGELKASFKMAEKMIERCTKDEKFMQYMSGEKQKIFTADLFGCKWKCKLDSYIPNVAIVDLKTSANIHKAWKVADYGWCSFVEMWGYTTQLAVYQKIVQINTGYKLPCYIAVVTKEDYPDIEIINIDQTTLDDALNKVQANMPNVLAIKKGELEPTRCERCDYCKTTKKIMRPVSMFDLITEE